MPNFETFERRMASLTQNPTAVLQKTGVLSLNKSAQVALGEPEAVELLFDPEAEIIGLRPVSADKLNAYPLRPQRPEVGPYLVAATAFTKYYKIDTSVSRRYVTSMDEGILCIELKGESTAVSSNRSGSGRSE
ncbi:hypothetical protein [Pseudonocardia spinosispora]|uniref:hypothetical protein n=1 Tax=Pseudonocardia spinosispora TaxID=103441 RepID=UPI0012EBBBF4|nr:hypothetical protein [Pseudonocardia spinosispora]